MPKPQILVFSDERDKHVPFVSKHLRKSSLIILDQTQIIENKAITIRVDNDAPEVVYDGVLLDSVAGVWFRKPLPFDESKIKIQPEYMRYAVGALNNIMVQLFELFEDAVWVSRPSRIITAHRKVHQKNIALKLGMNVPKTLVSTDLAEIEKFFKTSRAVIGKPLGTIHPKIKDKQSVFLTARVTFADFKGRESIKYAPVILQEEIDVAEELRVLVVGDKVFAAAVRSNDTPIEMQEKGIRDNRTGNYEGSVTIEAREFPEDLTKKCVEMNRILDLSFGAYDFIIDNQGKYWFLENNPNGQWAYVEMATGQEIGKAIAELLESEID